MLGDGQRSFTAAERKVLEYLLEGMSNKEIAQHIGCAVRTVEFHVTRILRKSGESSRAKVLVKYRKKTLDSEVI